jgi:hypothetical protein
VLDIAMTKPRLQLPRIVARIRQRIAAAVAQHVPVNWEWYLGPSTNTAKERVEGFGRHWSVPLSHEDMRRRPLLAL